LSSPSAKIQLWLSSRWYAGNSPRDHETLEANDQMSKFYFFFIVVIDPGFFFSELFASAAQRQRLVPVVYTLYCPSSSPVRLEGAVMSKASHFFIEW